MVDERGVFGESLGCEGCDAALTDFLTNGPGKPSCRSPFQIRELTEEEVTNMINLSDDGCAWG